MRAETTLFDSIYRLAKQSLTPAEAAGFAASGGTVVRKGFDPAAANGLRPQVSQFHRQRYDSMKQLYRQGHELTPQQVQQMHAGVCYFDELLETKLGRSLLTLFLTTYVKGPAFRFLTETIGDDLIFPLPVCALRAVVPVNEPAIVPYHQDVAFMGERYRSFNHWIALTPCGPDQEAPSLEFVETKLDARVPLLPDDQRRYLHHQLIEVGDERIRSDYAAQLRKPDFMSGDGILFDQFTLHRTHVGPKAAKVRHSIELRTCRTDEAADDYPVRVRATVSDGRVRLALHA